MIASRSVERRLTPVMDRGCCSSSCERNEADTANTVVFSPTTISSPVHSIGCSDSELCTTESVTSVEESSRPGSDRFHLGGEFSSFDDSHVSGTSSESERNSFHQPLLNLNILHKRPVKRKLIVQSQPTLSDSPDNDKDPLLLSPSKTVSLDHPLTLAVSIPLNLVNVTHRIRKSPTKLALGHFAVSRKKMQSDDLEDTGSNLGTPRTPLSLKLKKSAFSNQWHPVTTIDISTLQNDATPDKPDKPDKLDSLSNIQSVNNNITSITNTTPATELLQPPSSTDILLPVDPIILSSTDDDYYLSDYNQSSSSNASDFLPFRKTRKTPPTRDCDTNYTFCFNDVFKSFLPELTVINEELRPVKSLSLKGVWAIPNDHPINLWTIGKPVNATSKGRRLKKHQ